MSITILGIESSCDDTSASVIRDGVLLSNIIAGQAVHQSYGGVVPELASRAHQQNIIPVVAEAIKRAGIDKSELSAVAFTRGPGLMGSLLVGTSFAKGFSASLGIPMIEINHLQAHVLAHFIKETPDDTDQPTYPFLCLLVSGGNSQIIKVNAYNDMEVIGQTIDDAAGEAFDKIAKLMNLPYPGGPVIEKLAAQVNFQDFFHYTRGSMAGLNFSFSGLKTSILYDMVKRGAYDLQAKKFLKSDDLEFQQQVASSLLVCMGDIFEKKLALALKEYPQVKAITFVGGVACNKYLRAKLQTFCESKRIQLFYPSGKLCTDNAGMIAFVGSYKANQGKFTELDLSIF